MSVHTGSGGNNGRGGNSSWVAVTSARPCPVCNKTKQCRLSGDGRLSICYNAGRPDSIGPLQAKDGRTYYRTWLVPRDDPIPSPTCRPVAGAKKADPDILDRVYRSLLGHMTLSDTHRAALRKRGFNDLFAQKVLYRSLGRDRVRAVAKVIADGLEHHLPYVPGFAVKKNDATGKEYWSIGGPGGLLIPTYDLERRVVALKVRVDEDTGGGKYRMVSCPKKDTPGCGTPTHFPAIDVRDKTICRVTEGSLKADVATLLSDTYTIGLHSVGQWARAAAALEAVGAKVVRVAFDADARGNPNVATALDSLVNRLIAKGFTVELEVWDAADGKGIDDLLAARKQPQVIVGHDEVRAAVAAIVQGAGAKANAKAQRHAAAAGGDDVVEADNDPHRLAKLYIADACRDGVPLVRYWREEWHRWEGGAYGRVPDKEIRAALNMRVKAEFDRLNRLEVAEWREQGCDGDPPKAMPVTDRLVGNVLSALAGVVCLSGRIEQPAWLDRRDGDLSAAEILPCRNCAVHLPSWAAGKEHVSPPTPRLFTPVVLPYDYAPHAPVPRRWLEFLAQLWPDDPSTIDTLQEWLGYNLLPDTSQQKIAMFVGPRRSGKGTIARVLTALVGPGNVCSPTLGSLGTNFGLQPLIGKLVAIISDARLSARTDAAIVTERLLSISGEDGQTIDRKFMSSVTAKLPIRFTVMTNELPRLLDASNALTGRLIIFRMTRSFYGSEDVRLTDRLLAELPGILLWAMEGWRRLRDRGYFVQPASSVRLIREMEDLASPVGAFLRDCCRVEPGREVPMAELYQRWRRWCEQVGRDPTSEQIFGRDLRAAVPNLDDRQPRVGGLRVRYYVGVGLRSAEEEAEDDHPGDDLARMARGPHYCTRNRDGTDKEEGNDTREKHNTVDRVPCVPGVPGPATATGDREVFEL